jgi:hypothetical protein
VSDANASDERHEEAEVQGARRLQARLRASGETLPESLQDATFAGPNTTPEFIVESAEGVATFEGFNGRNPQPHAEAWLEARFTHIGTAYGAQAAGASESAHGWLRKRIPHRDQ